MKNWAVTADGPKPEDIDGKTGPERAMPKKKNPNISIHYYCTLLNEEYNFKGSGLF